MLTSAGRVFFADDTAYIGGTILQSCARSRAVRSYVGIRRPVRHRRVAVVISIGSRSTGTVSVVESATEMPGDAVGVKRSARRTALGDSEAR